MTGTSRVVGNLIGAATVEAVAQGQRPSRRCDRADGRSASKRDRRSPRSRTARLREQVKQAQASYDVAAATIRQREADLRLAQTNLDRSKNLFERQLIPKQTFDDTDARYQAAARAGSIWRRRSIAGAGAPRRAEDQPRQHDDHLSPVSGFVGKRSLDPGAWVTPNSAFISVVDISVVRLVANIVEKDLRTDRTPGMKARRRGRRLSGRARSQGESRTSRRSSIRPRAPRRSKSRFDNPRRSG